MTTDSWVNGIWILFGAVLVCIMQVGFTMFETGFIRGKNMGSGIMKNIMDIAIGSVMFFTIGFALMFGGSNGGVVGSPGLFSAGDYSAYTGNAFSFLFFQTTLCLTAVTIVSGAMAERAKFSFYIALSIAVSALVYPLVGHWVWNRGGWLSRLGFVDFAGSSVVNLAGGAGALAGSALLGPRIGKYSASGKSGAIPGHSLTLSALGLLLLWAGWFGFGGGHLVSPESGGAALGTVFININLSAAAGAVVSMVITWMRYGKPDLSMIFNGVLGGLVAICAGCNLLDPLASLFTGALAAFVVVFGIEWVDQKLKIDDPVGAISAHGLCGLLGVLTIGLFSRDGGLFFSGSFRLLGVQLLGGLAVAGLAGGAVALLALILKKTSGIRVDAETEMRGLDVSEHGVGRLPLTPLAYSETSVEIDRAGAREIDIENAMESLKPSDYVADGKIRNVAILMRPEQFTSLKIALQKIDITGMTVTEVSGCGIQRGHAQLYRGSELDIQLLPKIKVEIVISTVPLGLLVDTVKTVLRTGKVGDGKIFVYGVESVVKIRTGEEGKAALV
jgi:Amt family ammonium transporter